MVERTSLLVIGAGPYGVATAARAIERGIDTVVLGRPLSFWTEHMPSGMFLRSGIDWHLDAAGIHTFEAFLDDAGIPPEDIDPVPVDVFLAYAAWFTGQKRVVVRDDPVRDVRAADGVLEAVTAGGRRITAEAVVAAPGVAASQALPEWAGSVPDGIGRHTCDLVRFDRLAGARVLIVGGRQSAYEWAALLAEAGAQRVDVVHRHDEPRFDRVDWGFVDPYMAETRRVRGWWRRLPQAHQEAIARRFWEAGRVTLEWWLTPRLTGAPIHRWPGTWVTQAARGPGEGEVTVRLSTGDHLVVDRVVYATGYRPRLDHVPYLSGVGDGIRTVDGFPALDESFQSTCPGLYVTGALAARDFGPFFGFTRGCPEAAALIVDALERTRP